MTRRVKSVFFWGSCVGPGVFYSVSFFIAVDSTHNTSETGMLPVVP